MTVASLHDLTLAEAADLITHAQAVAGRIHARLAGAHGGARAAAQRLHHPHAGGGPRGCAGGGSRDRARQLSRSPARHSLRREGHLRHRRRPDVRPFAHSASIACRCKDATAVAKLRAAGAVLTGKLATHEFAHGGPSFDLPWPPARNPWNTAHFTGGSSSGSGAAIAAGLVPASLGSRYRRLDPRPRRPVRHRRPQADLRSRQPRRRAAQLLFLRPLRADGAHVARTAR